MILPQTHLNLVMLSKDLFAAAKAITPETRQRFVTLSEVEELFQLRICNFNFQELFPAVHYIFCGEPRHKRMPLPSGLGLLVFIRSLSYTR